MTINVRNIIAICLLLVTSWNYSQPTNEGNHLVSIYLSNFAILEIQSISYSNISLTGNIPSRAGEAVIFNETDTKLWLNYSSTISGSSTEAFRNITVQITNGTVPNGLILSVIASQDVGAGEGTMGIAVLNAIELNSLNTSEIINEVGSAYTGYGANKGHNLTYSLNQDASAGSYADLDFDQTQTLSITYTLSDN